MAIFEKGDRALRILVIGSGGREHALACKLSESPQVDDLFCVPGNAGMAEIATCQKLDIMDNDELLKFAKKIKADLTVVGPELPLVNGLVDCFSQERVTVFGPTSVAARLEGSKIFAKELMVKYGIPTGKSRTFQDRGQAIRYIGESSPPVVIKADGLAAGKGVTVALDREAAREAVDLCLVKRAFGQSGQQILIEEFLEGQEVSLLAFSDGERVVPMEPAQDYKRIFDGDRGPNTGGMGSYCPVPFVSPHIYQEIVEKILQPTITALGEEGIKYKGVIYGGLILTDEGSKVLEFNVRFGDPETQAILPRLKSDLLEIMIRTVEEDLEGVELQWSPESCVSVVLASRGYPQSSTKGVSIYGLEEAKKMESVYLFHAATERSNGELVTDGGRVLAVSALGKDFQEARRKAYLAVDKITFEGMQFRRDIAARVCG
ncbi:phosphoribosylamine--glycine ligase [Candidatus Hakubella thermalkaliphila]|uniref:phosphoribosylamine--glycine ligase n=1 Tax=Candidatus Hakubella thermalkaliphila TaxID=2754717 RepID=UPI00280ACAA6|nr:phosphoribosylamine--glycine ligase [Candidatus Hakubella thermalkaliphila]